VDRGQPHGHTVDRRGLARRILAVTAARPRIGRNVRQHLVVVFPGSGVTDNLAAKPKAMGIPLFDCRRAAGAPASPFTA
jgi:hypothetical protein